MTESAQRWIMTAVGAPMSKTEFSPPDPGAGEVTVEIAGCGVCHTDLGYLYDGVRTNHELPLTLGHEISGTVVAAGKGAGTMAAYRRRVKRGELFPPFLFLALTNDCNLRCRGCWIENSGGRERLSLDDVEGIIIFSFDKC